jgi:hypothetical protein
MAQGPWRSPIRPPRQFAATQQFSRFGAKRTFSEPRLNRIYEYAPYYERAPAPTTRRTSTRSARRQGWATQAPLRHLTREFIRAAGAAGRRVRDLRQAAGETAAGKPAFTLPAISVTEETARYIAEGAMRITDVVPPVTELLPAGDFWEAEPEHQDYLERYPNGYTCHFVRPQWKLRQQFLSSCSNSCQALVCLVGDDV